MKFVGCREKCCIFSCPGINCPVILMPPPFIGIERLEEGRIAHMELVRADAEDRSCGSSCQARVLVPCHRVSDNA